MKWIITLIVAILFTSCATINTNIMIGVTSEYEDHVYFYEDNQNYHCLYDIKFICTHENISLCCDNFFHKILFE